MVTNYQLGLIVALFFLWGIANNLNDILIQQFKTAFTLGNMQASLVQSAFYMGYFFGALPAAQVAHKYGFKAATLVGLSLFSLGCWLFFPNSRNGGWYPGFLACLYLIAFGLAFLETSANPWIIVLAEAQEHGSGTKALNFAQSFNPLGSIAGILIGRFFILDDDIDASKTGDRRLAAGRVGIPYLVLGTVVAVVACAFWAVQFPEGSSEQGLPKGFTSSISRLLQNTFFLLALAAQFTYVGAQVSVWSFIIQYVQANIPGTGEQQASDFIVISLVLFVIGRFVASALLHVTREDRLLGTYAFLACIMCVIASTVGGWIGVVSVSLISFFMSMMFPTIFGIGVSLLDNNDMEVGASLLVMAIIGGAIFPPLMGYVGDAYSITLSYLVPAACFLVVVAFAMLYTGGKLKNSEGQHLIESSKVNA